jgi:hypothetical protein
METFKVLSSNSSVSRLAHRYNSLSVHIIIIIIETVL